jgi:hypothetical protein
MDLGFEAGIGFFLALALCFGVCKIVMVIGRGVAHDIALFRRTRRSRRLAKSMEEFQVKGQFVHACSSSLG